MLEVIVLVHTVRAATYTPLLILKMLCSMEEYPCKPPLQDRHGEMHSLRQTDAMANLGWLQEIAKP